MMQMTVTDITALRSSFTLEEEAHQTRQVSVLSAQMSIVVNSLLLRRGDLE
jgi:hypothetical protein